MEDNLRFFQRFFVIVFTILLLWFLYEVRLAFYYFAYAILISYLISPVIFLLRRLRVPKVVAIFIAFILFGALLVGFFLVIIPIVSTEINNLVLNLPDTVNRIMIQVNEFITERYKLFTDKEIVFSIQDQIEAWALGIRQNLPNVLPTALKQTFGFLLNATSFIVGVVVVPIMSFYLIEDAVKIKENFVNLFPERFQEPLNRSLAQINHSLGGYIRGIVTLGVIGGAMTYLGLFPFHIKYALLLALIAALGRLIPIAGPILAAIPAILIGLSQSAVVGLYVLILYIVVDIIESNIIAPKILGQSLGLHPLTVIMSILVGGSLAGAVGILLALPVASSMKILVKSFWREGLLKPATTSGSAQANDLSPPRLEVSAENPGLNPQDPGSAG